MGKGIYAALGAIALGMAGPAVAQGIPVYDSSGYLQALATVKNTLSMIDQGKEQIAEAKQLYGSFNQVTDVNGIASSLSTDAMRHLLPREARDISRLMSSDNASLGSLGSSATRMSALPATTSCGTATSQRAMPRSRRRPMACRPSVPPGSKN